MTEPEPEAESGTPARLPGSPFDLTGRRAAVTGANRGIGAGIALALAEAGADLVLLSRGSAAATGEEARALGREVVELQCDLEGLDEDSTRLLADRAAGEGPVDILVNNAGMIYREDAVDHDSVEFARVVQVNLTAQFLLCQAFGRTMVQRGDGKIINVASLLSFQGGIRVPGYAAAKHGVAGLTKALANEWASHGVCVNAIAPGYIATDNTAALRNDPQRAADILGRIPAGRWGSAADIGGAAVFLAGPASDYVQGHVLVVDGGWMAR